MFSSGNINIKTSEDIMKKLIVILLLCAGFLSLMIILLPHLISKEPFTYDEAVQKFAKGKLVSLDGKKVHYIEKGSGDPVILIHGFFYHTMMWNKNMDALAENHKVYAIDLFGWGFSERLDETEYSFERYARQITGFMDALGIRKASLIGQSMGGSISVYVAAHYPERVNKLIFVAPTVLSNPDTIAGKIYKLPFIGEFLNAIPGNGLIKNNLKTVWFYDGSHVTDAYVAELAQPFGITGSHASAMHVLRHVLKDPFVESEGHLLAQKNKPILIVHGREDKAVPVHNSMRLNELWPGSELVIYEKTGHNPHDEQSEQFNQLAIEFLSQ
jgi:pimeloyl-ACP methyl ester carboxylesterase